MIYTFIACPLLTEPSYRKNAHQSIEAANSVSLLLPTLSPTMLQVLPLARAYFILSLAISILAMCLHLIRRIVYLLWLHRLTASDPCRLVQIEEARK